MEAINLAQKLALFEEHWKPKIVGQVNEFYVKVVKVQGEFIWHAHEEEDELFLVVKGSLVIQLREGETRLEEGEFVIVPRGVEHRPMAEEEAHVLLLEPKSTVNTGDVEDARTVEPEWV